MADDNESTASVDEETEQPEEQTEGEDRPGESDEEPAEQDDKDREQGEDKGSGRQEGDEEERPRSRASERIRELNERARRSELEADFWRKKAESATGNGAAPKAPELPAELKDLDTAMSPLFKHYLTPLQEALVQARLYQEWMTDRAEFYDEHPEYRSKKHREIIESATAALSSRMKQRVDRDDVLMYLRGHTKYGKLFVAEEDRKQALAETEVAARRTAGKVGGRAPTAKARGEREAPDLASMTPAQRIKFFESQHGDTPF